MPHLLETTLIELVEHRLGRGEAAAAELHLDACVACRQLVAALARGTPVPPPRRVAEVTGTLMRGMTLGRYVILDVLGRGGMGTVYAAYDPELDRKIAVKLLRSDLTPDEAATTRLIREAQALARLSHPSVVAIYDVGRVEDVVYLVMEYVEGGTLADWLTETRSLDDIVRAFALAGHGLAAAHAAGLIHRDVKPSNILVSADGRVLVTDFGLARTEHAAPESPADRSSQTPDQPTSLPIALTGSRTVIGTPAYMAPEQYRHGAVIDARADQFAFCVALFEAVHGRRPFLATSFDELRAKVLTGSIDAGLTSDAPRWLDRLLVRGLAPSPDARFADMDELLARLMPDRRRLYRRLAGAAAITAIAAAAPLVIASRNDPAVLPVACTHVADKAAEIWNPDTSQVVRHAFLATGAPLAESTAAAVTRALETFADNWAIVRTEACEATHLRGEQSAERLDRQLACLDRTARDARALVGVLATADRDVVSHAVEAVRQLDVQACSQLTLPVAPAAPAAPAASVAAASAFELELAKLRALGNTGRDREALSLAESLRDTLPTSDPRATTELLLELGQLRGRAGDGKAARTALFEALSVADEAHADDLRARAWQYILSSPTPSAEDIERWTPLALAVSERLHNNPIMARTHHAIGVANRAAGRIDRARAHLARARELTRVAPGTDALREMIDQTLVEIERDQPKFIATDGVERRAQGSPERTD
ncbi:MAG: protein kinase [Kofleriaceae bacterium]